MPRINEVGTFQMLISVPRWELLDEKDGEKNRMALVLPLVLESNNANIEDKHETFFLYFTRTITSTGQNTGKALYQVSAEICESLGMSKPFSPDKIAELHEKEVRVTMQEEKNQKGEMVIKPRFINSMREELSMESATKIWDELKKGGFTEEQGGETPFD